MELIRNEERIKELRQRAAELVAQMTLEEKVSQMMHAAPAIERLSVRAYNWWNEALHGVARAGVATVFPQAIGLAATFDEDFAEEIGDAISTEGRGKYNSQQKYGDTGIYKGLTFWCPNINIFRDPRWGRGHETLGEDPYLTSRMGVRLVEGIQGHDENVMKAAACAKHLAVHSGPEDLRHGFNAEVSKQDLYETYLPAFKALVQEAKVEAVMGAYNRVNGAPCCGSKLLLTDILRKEWGFQGHVVSDCFAVKDFHEGHGVTGGPLESAALAVNNGCDLNCGSMFLYVEEGVKKGLISEERVDEALVNLFTTRMKLGMFEKNGTVYDAIPYTAVDSADMQALNRRAAEKSVVLLKNENNLLPLDINKIKTIGIIGPNANNRKALIGNYAGTASRYFTVSEGIMEYVGDKVRVLYSEGCHLHKITKRDYSSEIKAVCEESDVVILCLGLDSGLEGEQGDAGNEYASGDKPNLDLPGRQQEIMELAVSCKKPVVLVLLSGSALAVTWADEHVPAILQGWYPGAQGGRAIARVLFGDKNPEGKLPITFYRSTKELPEFTDYSMKGRTYRYMEQEALYPFGYGLSYTDFAFEQGEITGVSLKDGEIRVNVTVINTGKREGTEAVQVYVKANREGTPNAQLKGLCKVTLQPEESRRVSLKLPVSAFGLCDEEGRSRVEPGEYLVYVGGSQPDTRSIALTGKIPLCFSVQIDDEIIV